MFRKRKILFFLFGGVGGAERMTVNIGIMLPRENYEVIFVVCGIKDDICQFIPPDYEVIRIPWHNIYCFPRLRMANVILHKKPDFVFSSHMTLNYRLLQVSSLLDVKCVVRNNNMLKQIPIFRQKKMKKWYRNAHYVIAQQDEMGDEIITKLEVPPEKVKVLYNILDENAIKEKITAAENPYHQNNRFKYLCLNRFHPTKAQDVTLKAFEKVHYINPNTELYFVGHAKSDNPLVIKVKKMIEDMELQDYVHIVGFDPNPYKWDRYADCYITTSRQEGLPNVLIEAQYLGTPAVATECIPMISRIITNGVTGFTVPVDDVDAIAEAMLKAQNLGRIVMTYKPAEIEDFKRIFQ